jgi:hypothetical protein
MLSHAAGDTGVPSDRATLLQRYRELRYEVPSGHIAVDVSTVRFEDGYLERMALATRSAMDAMAALEAGSLANAYVRRRLGYYRVLNHVGDDGSGRVAITRAGHYVARTHFATAEA